MLKKPLLGQTQAELKEVANELGMPSFSARQITDWLYKKKVRTIDAMTNLSLNRREKLKENYTIGCSDYTQVQNSVDGTRKYLFPVSGDKFVETVYIPDKERATICISSQVGCKMNCLFCMTGKQKFASQLSSGEILNQILSLPECEQLTNYVFMGMGEPLDNEFELFKTLEIMTADYGLALSPKRITVSTVGVPKLQRLLEETNCHVAISLHSPYHEERLSLAPAEKAYPAEKIIELIKQYDFSRQRRISFEYILFGGLNDDRKHARDLVRFLSGIPCRVNLIKYHPIPNVNLPGTNTEQMVPFRDYLSSHGIISTIRSSRGEDILAACGMLSTKKNYEL
ncbi:MAG: 23S rRNA (adenine(2503)-C(2))-methyltransferase RlmN [Candidatus Azobacteroides sp.]|nr:23S rRNA (adenine(2503)-C(2))-methyltransferase RlmN [Candidatus Azobacteroides sp.]